MQHIGTIFRRSRTVAQRIPVTQYLAELDGFLILSHAIQLMNRSLNVMSVNHPALQSAHHAAISLL